MFHELEIVPGPEQNGAIVVLPGEKSRQPPALAEAFDDPVDEVCFAGVSTALKKNIVQVHLLHDSCCGGRQLLQYILNCV
jgi:hypothetical protein